MRALVLAAGLLVAGQAGAGLMIYGGDGHDIFLGCLNCNEFSKDSICNEFGAGSEFGSNSIFNQFSKFGNEFSSDSPWNEFSSSKSVPVVVDENGEFYGYFTINEIRRDAVAFSGNLKKMFDISNGDLTVVRNMLCSI